MSRDILDYSLSSVGSTVVFRVLYYDAGFYKYLQQHPLMSTICVRAGHSVSLEKDSVYLAPSAEDVQFVLPSEEDARLYIEEADTSLRVAARNYEQCSSAETQLIEIDRQLDSLPADVVKPWLERRLKTVDYVFSNANIRTWAQFSSTLKREDCGCAGQMVVDHKNRLYFALLAPAETVSPNTGEQYARRSSKVYCAATTLYECE